MARDHSVSAQILHIFFQVRYDQTRLIVEFAPNNKTRCYTWNMRILRRICHKKVLTKDYSHTKNCTQSRCFEASFSKIESLKDLYEMYFLWIWSFDHIFVVVNKDIFQKHTWTSISHPSNILIFFFFNTYLRNMFWKSGNWITYKNDYKIWFFPAEILKKWGQIPFIIVAGFIKSGAGWLSTT